MKRKMNKFRIVENEFIEVFRVFESYFELPLSKKKNIISKISEWVNTEKLNIEKLEQKTLEEFLKEINKNEKERFYDYGAISLDGKGIWLIKDAEDANDQVHDFWDWKQVSEIVPEFV